MKSETLVEVSDFYNQPLTIAAKQIVRIERPWQFRWFDGTTSGPRVCPLLVRVNRRLRKMSAPVETLLRAGLAVPS